LHDRGANERARELIEHYAAHLDPSRLFLLSASGMVPAGRSARREQQELSAWSFLRRPGLYSRPEWPA
jgi:hypothetical protein